MKTLFLILQFDCSRAICVQSLAKFLCELFSSELLDNDSWVSFFPESFALKQYYLCAFARNIVYVFYVCVWLRVSCVFHHVPYVSEEVVYVSYIYVCFKCQLFCVSSGASHVLLYVCRRCCSVCVSGVLSVVNLLYVLHVRSGCQLFRNFLLQTLENCHAFYYLSPVFWYSSHCYIAQ